MGGLQPGNGHCHAEIQHHHPPATGVGGRDTAKNIVADGDTDHRGIPHHESHRRETAGRMAADGDWGVPVWRHDTDTLPGANAGEADETDGTKHQAGDLRRLRPGAGVSLRETDG